MWRGTLKIYSINVTFCLWNVIKEQKYEKGLSHSQNKQLQLRQLNLWDMDILL